MRYTLILSMIMGFFGCSTAQKNYTDLSVVDAKQLITSDKTLQVLDVRTPEECNGGMIKGAKKANWNAASFENDAMKLDRTKPVLVYCAVGGRSSKAAQKLHALGFEKVYNLKGGYNAWSSQ